MENIVIDVSTILYVICAAVIWLMGRVVTLIEKATKEITRLTVVIGRVEKDMGDHEERLRNLEREKNDEGKT